MNVSKKTLGALAIIIAGALLAAPFVFKPYGIYILSLWAVTTIGAMGLNLTLGYAGQISLAQAAFVGIGAYISAILTKNGYPLPLAYLLAFVSCFAIGWVLGYPALRVEHHYLAFVTLAFTTLVYLIFRNEEWLTGGVSGIGGIPRPVIFGYSLKDSGAFYYFCIANLAVISLAFWGLIRSPWGRAFIAVRENPVRALSLGIDTQRYTLMAFAIGAGLGGVSGVLLSPLVGFIDPSPFALTTSLNLLLMVVIGGSGYFFGPFVGTIVAVLLPEWLRFSGGFYLIFYALLVMVLMAVCPTGLIGLAPRVWRFFVKPPAAPVAAERTT